MQTRKIEEIIDLAEARDLDELEIEEKGVRIRVVRRSARMVPGMPTGAPVTHSSAPPTGNENHGIPDGLHGIRSPMVGVYLAPDEDGETGMPLVGDRIEVGDVMGFVEAMKMRTELTADVSGEVVEVLVADQQAVESGKPLFLLRPDK